MGIQSVFKPIRGFFEILGIYQTLLWLGGGTMTTASIVTFLQSVPIYIPIILLVLGLITLGLSIFKTIYRYRLWNNLKVIPEIDVVLVKALRLHFHIKELSRDVVEQNRKKNIKTKIRMRLAEKYFDTIGISKKDLPKYFNDDYTIKQKKLDKKMRKIHHLKQSEYSTILPLLSSYKRLLNKSKLGLKDSVESSKTYDSLNESFMEAQLKLTVPEAVMNDINSLPELSIGLNSLAVGINLINENRKWYKDIPESFKDQKEETESFVDTAYMKASMWLKIKVRKTMFERVMK